MEDWGYQRGEFEHGEFNENHDFHNFFNFASPESQLQVGQLHSDLTSDLLEADDTDLPCESSQREDDSQQQTQQRSHNHSDSHNDIIMNLIADSGSSVDVTDEYSNRDNHQLSANIVNPNELFRSPALEPQWSEDNFTPLMSPSSTPLENCMTSSEVPTDFTMPSAYFSPTNSPVIESDPRLLNSTNNNSNTQITSQLQSRRRVKGTTPVLGPSRVSKLSPMVRPNNPVSASTKRKSAMPGNDSSTGSSDSVSPEGVNEVMAPPKGSGQLSTNSLNYRTRSRSSSLSRRTSIVSNTSSNSTIVSDRGGGGAATAPATPASLMNIGRKLSMGEIQSEDKIHGALRAIASASSSVSGTPVLKPRLRRASSSSTSIASSSLIAPKIKPKMSVWKSGSNSVGSSPVIMPNGTSPSISPNILPKKSSEVSDLSMLLASKSNYQNIVEGNHNQLGLSYPDHLSADLTFKKTSHKLAEQGRRNRINSALTELARLIAPSGQTNSKANTVEQAITFIKELQDEIVQLKERLSVFEESKITKE